MSEALSLAQLFGSQPPSNWGKWGPDDEVGSLNYLDKARVLAGIREVVDGEVFTLQVPMGRTESPGDPVWPPRQPMQRRNVLENASFESGAAQEAPGGLRYVDDTATIWLQGSTQYDGLGHAWYEGKLWNGYDADTTNGAMLRASVLPIAERGVVGRAVLVDMARYQRRSWLEKGDSFSHEDVLAAARAQGTEIQPRDILCIRTGFLKSWYETADPGQFFENFTEPGLTYSAELVSWFRDMEIPNLVTDTGANEVHVDPKSGAMLPLHAALMRNLGVAFTELAWFEELATACARDGRFSFFYAAAPLKIVHGTGAPVNPIAIR